MPFEMHRSAESRTILAQSVAVARLPTPHLLRRFLDRRSDTVRFTLALVLTALLPSPGARAAAIDASTLTGKLIMGYQGWFECPGDGGGRGWVHWSAGGAPTVDMLPDVTELPPSELCRTPLTAPGNRPVYVFSSRNPATVDRHFAWMEQYGLDGVALQRFATLLVHPELVRDADALLDNVRHAAEAHGRVFFLMYDLSGLPPEKLPLVAQDWARLEAQGLTRSAAYQRHRGHPVLGVWGLGFAGRPMTPTDAKSLLTSLAPGVTLMGGVPAGWRTGTGDASPDPGWRSVWPMLGVLSPWTVGRFRDDVGADAYRRATLEPDLREAVRIGVDDMPVVFPGFSWANLMRARHTPGPAVENQIPRACGRFYWHQVFNARAAGATMLYGAMFDEVDEGTAMFKLLPASGPTGFVTLDADGCRLPSDWYLRLAGAATASLRRGVSPGLALPLLVP